MNYIKEAISVLMVLIPLGAAPRIIYCLCKLVNDPDQEHTYKTRIKNLAAFVVIGECALGIITLLRGYF